LIIKGVWLLLKPQSKDGYNNLIFLLLIIAVSASVLYYFSDIWPTQGQYFYEFSILDRNNSTRKYFPNNSPKLYFATTLRWNILIKNNMAEDKKINIKFKILNETENNLYIKYNYTSHNYIWNKELNINKGADRSVLFKCYVNHYVIDDEKIIIDELNINDDIVIADVITEQGKNIYMKFELWTYDDKLNDYIMQDYRSGEKYKYELTMICNFNVPIMVTPD